MAILGIYESRVLALSFYSPLAPFNQSQMSYKYYKESFEI